MDTDIWLIRAMHILVSFLMSCLEAVIAYGAFILFAWVGYYLLTRDHDRNRPSGVGCLAIIFYFYVLSLIEPKDDPLFPPCLGWLYTIVFSVTACVFAAIVLYFVGLGLLYIIRQRTEAYRLYRLRKLEERSQALFNLGMTGTYDVSRECRVTPMTKDVAGISTTTPMTKDVAGIFTTTPMTKDVAGIFTTTPMTKDVAGISTTTPMTKDVAGTSTTTPMTVEGVRTKPGFMSRWFSSISTSLRGSAYNMADVTPVVCNWLSNPHLKSGMQLDPNILTSRYGSLDEPYIRRHKDVLYWDYISQYQHLSPEFIDEFADRLNWYLLLQYQIVPTQLLEKYFNRCDMSLLSRCFYLEEEFITSHAEDLHWDLLSKYYEFNDNFLVANKERVYWRYIAKYQKVSDKIKNDFRGWLSSEWLARSWWYKTDSEKRSYIVDLTDWECDDDYFYGYIGVRKNGCVPENCFYRFNIGEHYHRWANASRDKENFGLTVYSKKKIAKSLNAMRVKVRYADVARVITDDTIRVCDFDT